MSKGDAGQSLDSSGVLEIDPIIDEYVSFVIVSNCHPFAWAARYGAEGLRV